MGTLVITFRSVTPAQRAEHILHSMGLRCHLGRTPRWMEEQGCGYSLRVRYTDLESVVVLLHNHKVAFRKLYLAADNGTLEELKL